MNVSLNEVEALAKKAARGVGYSWGLADEAGRATRWLCAHRFDGTASLLGLLNTIDHSGIAQCTPNKEGNDWRSASGKTCPLHMGAALLDRIHDFECQGTQTVYAIERPIFLLPFAEEAAIELGTAVRLSLGDQHVMVDKNTVSRTPLIPDFSMKVEVALASAELRSQPLNTRATPNEHCWAELNKLASRTYAPSTEQSRKLGANSGTSDND